MPDWPHSPVHRLNEAGTYIVTAATYNHNLFFLGKTWLDLVRDRLFEHANKFDWQLQAWAILPNHYHFVALAEHPENLSEMLGSLHANTAREVNLRDHTPERMVWYQYWDTQITYQRSYLARLNYVHHNPVHHRLVQEARNYSWCSAAWFERTAAPAFQKTVRSFGASRIKINEIACDRWE
jgi:putative transposase